MAIVLTDSQHYSNIANAIREKNGSGDTYTPAQMAEAISAISCTGGGSEGSLDHTVTFIDDTGETVASYSVKSGIGIHTAPNGVNANKWIDESGNNITFPITPSSDIILTADNSTAVSDSLYNAYGLSKAEYPYACVSVTSKNRIRLYFFQSFDQYNPNSYLYPDGVVVTGYNVKNSHDLVPTQKIETAAEAVNALVVNKQTLRNDTSCAICINPVFGAYGFDQNNYPLMVSMDA